MPPLASHLSDEQLLQSVDGELPPGQEKIVRAHLEACWTCRARLNELQAAISNFVHLYQRDTSGQPIAGPRALLKANLALLSETSSNAASRPHLLPRPLGWLAAASGCALLAVAFLHLRPTHPALNSPIVFSSPDARLTPGAAVLTNPQQLCSQAPINNKPVSETLQRAVFREYGISNPEPTSYEVDYLITPALGGADDIRNLWPHSYASTVWNAKVKDALETRLRQMVCDGSLDLATAQQEIAGNWIATYKQYFHTQQPLAP